MFNLFKQLACNNAQRAALGLSVSSTPKVKTVVLPSLPSILPLHTRDPYLLTNETGTQATLDHLAEKRQSADLKIPKVHIGFSGLENLNFIAASRADTGIICDVSNGTQELWGLVLPIIKTATSPADFKQKLLAQIKGREKYYFHLPDSASDENVQGELEKLDQQFILKNGWLNSQENFNHIKTLVKENQIQFYVMDIADQTRMGQVQRWVQESQVEVGSVYISNILEWFEDLDFLKQNEAIAKANVQALFTINTTVIDAQGNPNEEGGVRQMFYEKVEFLDRRPVKHKL